MLPQSNQGDLYTLEARPTGGNVWTATAGYREPMCAHLAQSVVKQLNLLSHRVVYRAVLVKVAA